MNQANDTQAYGPWNPGIQSAVPKGLQHLATIFRPDNVFGSFTAFTELHDLTGLPPGELAVFRPQRLALHELLIRVTADFAVPDGPRIEDLGINFRRIVAVLLSRHLEPQMDVIVAAYGGARRNLQDSIAAAFREVGADRGWRPGHAGDCERLAGTGRDPSRNIALRSLARVMSALFATHGCAWGSGDLVISLAADLACNDSGSEAIGRAIEPLLLRAARIEGCRLLPRQMRPVVINTKGPSASGKSTLRPLQNKLAGDIGVNWSDFALISPDIWRKQLLDYGSLGAAYKYAGAFTAEELRIIDRKLDRYMARKHERGDMTHLLIDRFRFDSFAPDSDEAGSNLLTRFGQTVYLFFVMTPPESLVERAWKRGLEVGRYKAVDDTLAHALDAYAGIPDFFFTWVRRRDKRIRFEFLDNTVRLGERPRTVAFGDNDRLNVLDVRGMLDIERYGRVNVDASGPQALYPDRSMLAAAHNTGFLRRCAGKFREVNFVNQATGRIYLRLESGRGVSMDRAELRSAVRDSDIQSGIEAVAPEALRGDVPDSGAPQYLHGGGDAAQTLGRWGGAGRARV
ncbi:MAG TPA: hypothetical protein VN692_14230 [Steroidobacteraceae bacterium]|nr:hypothetical protein [Steroidobacteraceae bacterium]